MSGIILKNSFIDAAGDLLAILPLLFATFFIIEVVEFFYFEKVSSFVKKSGKYAPFIGSIIASFPQCGFSIIASVLYIRGLITRGTLLAVYLSTSDEAIPVLLSAPQQYKLVLPIVAIKVMIGIIAGYIFDFIFPKKQTPILQDIEISQKGCCEHTLESKNKKDLIVHPVVHTLNIGIFILLITFFINIALAKCGSAEALGGYLMSSSPLQPVFAALFGLIPNCAISVALVMLYINNTIAFCSVIAGLCANSGLGIWVVISKNKDIKDSLALVLSLFLISALSGVILFLVQKFI